MPIEATTYIEAIVAFAASKQLLALRVRRKFHPLQVHMPWQTILIVLVRVLLALIALLRSRGQQFVLLLVVVSRCRRCRYARLAPQSCKEALASRGAVACDRACSLGLQHRRRHRKSEERRLILPHTQRWNDGPLALRAMYVKQWTMARIYGSQRKADKVSNSPITQTQVRTPDGNQHTEIYNQPLHTSLTMIRVRGTDSVMFVATKGRSGCLCSTCFVV